MIKQEAKMHTGLLKHLAKTEQMEIKVLNKVEEYVQYLFYVSTAFYGLVTLLVAYNVLKH